MTAINGPHDHQPERMAWSQRVSTRHLISRALVTIILGLVAILFLAPLLWMVSSSLKPLSDVFSPAWIPDPVAWENYPDALSSSPFGIYFRNTLLITVLSTIGAMLSTSAVAYSFARLNWPGRDLLFGLVLATMMLPGFVTLIPTYILFARIGWVNTFLPLIVPAWLGGNAFFVFLLRQFYRGIPIELTESARIDGAGEVRIWWQIIMPLSMPALATITIFAFNGAWQDYRGPLIYLHSERLYTLQIGLTTFRAGGGGIPLGDWMMAASLVVMLPILLVFFMGQRFFLQSVSLTGLKG